MRTRRTVAAAMLAALACAQSPTTARAAGEPVKIAVLADMSGPYADSSGPGLLLAVRMAVQDFGGSVLGRPLAVLFADDQNKPDIGSTTARRWLDDEGVSAIVEGSASSITLAVAELTRARQKIMLIAGSGSTDLTGKACSPTGFQFGFDTYSLPKAVVAPAVQRGSRKWFILGVDYAFGHSLRREATKFIEAAGGRVVGGAAFPLNTADFASYLLQAQGSGADAIALATAGADWTNILKQAHEFGMAAHGQVLVSLATGFNEVAGAGLDAAGGMLLATPFYWDMNDETRAFAQRFMAGHKGVAPNFQQAAGYSATLHYLEAIKTAGSTDGPAVAEAMRARKVHDFQMKDVPIRADGQVMRPMYLARVKLPAESKNRNDLYEVLATIPGDQAWRPAAESECKLLNGTR